MFEVDLAFGHHVGDLFRGFAEVFGEQLEDGYAGAHELEHVVALQFASGGDALKMVPMSVRLRPDICAVSATVLRDVGHLVAGFDAGGAQGRGHGGRVAQAERGAFDAGERVVHDFGDAFWSRGRGL